MTLEETLSEIERARDILSKAPHLAGNRLNYDTRQVQELHDACSRAHNILFELAQRITA